jgi:hypothetical protein
MTATIEASLTPAQRPRCPAGNISWPSCAARRCALLWQADIDAVGLALRGGLIEPEQAVELLRDCDALHLVAPNGGGPA